MLFFNGILQLKCSPSSVPIECDNDTGTTLWGASAIRFALRFLVEPLDITLLGLCFYSWSGDVEEVKIINSPF